jgi:drug/metabolite transporter (DMT)-like permease
MGPSPANRRTALAALTTAGVLWGLSVPLSKLALGWLSPAWLAVARFALAAPLMALAGRRGLRDALDLRVAALGAVGFGGVILLQNAGVARTSVSHACVVIGVVPVLVALIAARADGAGVRPRAWTGYAIAALGIALVAGSAGAGATFSGDALVFASGALSAGMIVLQPRVLAGRDPAAVTAVQFALPVALAGGPLPPELANPALASVLAFLALTLAGTLLPFWLFAHGQAHVDAEVAGAFVNLEPLVGAATGWLAFGDPASAVQLTGAAAVLVGIVLSTASPPVAGSEEGDNVPAVRAA